MEVQIILGSASVPRRTVLSAVLHHFECRRADIDERSVQAKDADSLPLAIAQAKAAHLMLTAGSQGVLITADQVVVGPSGVVRNKPVGMDDVREFMSEYAGSAVRLVSALVLTDLFSGRSVHGVDTCTVHFHDSLRLCWQECATPAVAQGLALLPWRSASAREAALAIDSRTDAATAISVSECAGAIALEHPSLAPHVSFIEGSPDCALGMPLATLSSCFERLGYPALPPLVCSS
jgi:predicted house-cleaning NTP pyrophosphatase (Maf/HAM1 superfamily)